MKRTILFAAAIASATPSVAADVTSEYTKLDLDKGCITVSTYEAGGTWACAGLRGYPVLFSEGDLRQSVFYGYVGEWFSEGAWESFGGFNNVGGTIEWRLTDGVPLAAIQRFHIDNIDEETGAPSEATRGQVLVVAKVAQPGVGDGCVVGYVDARENPDANEIARRLADETAPTFQCRVQEPEYHGKQGIFAGDPMRTFGP